jgi:hypothetical protein
VVSILEVVLGREEVVFSTLEKLPLQRWTKIVKIRSVPIYYASVFLLFC